MSIATDKVIRKQLKNIRFSYYPDLDTFPLVVSTIGLAGLGLSKREARALAKFIKEYIK